MENRLEALVDQRWRSVVGSDGAFEVSSGGQVRKAATGKLVTLTPNDRGYLCCGVAHHGKRKIRKVHVMVTEAFLGSHPDGQEVAFIDGVKSNCRLSNLRYGTPKEHSASRLSREGAVAPSAKLTRGAVREIREMIGRGVRFADIAARHGTSYGNVKKISQRATWNHI